MRSGGEVALFRLEGTLVKEVIGQTVLLACEINDKRYSTPDKLENPTRAATHLKHVLTKATPKFIDKFTARISETSPDIVAPWGRAVLYDQAVNQNRRLGIYSEFLTDRFVRAYAEGIESTMPGVSIVYVQGVKQPATAHKHFTGDPRASSAHRLYDRLSQRDLSIDVLATGARSSLDLLERVPKPLVVNNTRGMPIHGNIQNAARLSWTASSPSMTRFGPPNQPSEVFDLSRPDELSAFSQSVHRAL